MLTVPCPVCSQTLIFIVSILSSTEVGKAAELGKEDLHIHIAAKAPATCLNGHIWKLE